MSLFRLLKSRLGFTKSSRNQRRKPDSTRSRPTVEELESRVLLTGLVAAYNFDQGSGTTLTDVSGNGNNGTISNATWVSNGKFGGALQFTGATNSMVTIPDSSTLNLTKGMTLEAWVEATSLNSPDQGWVAPISKDNLASSANDVSYALYAANGTGTPPATHILRNGNDKGVQGSSVLPLNTWTFLAATYDGNTLKMYVNGNLVGSQTLRGSITTTSDPLHIGGDWSGEMFTGLIDNVRIYNTALSQSAIKSDMNTPVGSSTTSPTSPTVTSVTPANSATGVSTGSAVTVQFSEALDPTTVSSSTIQLLNASGTAVAASVTYNASTDTATLTPSSALSAGSTYTISVHGGTTGAVIKDAAGNALAANFSSSFSTAAAVDTTPPTVTSVTPANFATGVSTGSAITVQFSEALNSSTVSSSTVQLLNAAGTAVAASVTYNASTFTATLTPSSALLASSTYTISVHGGTTGAVIKDTAGNALAANFSSSFSTAAAVDTTPPTVTSVTPANSATGVSTGSAVTVQFSEALNATTLSSSTIQLLNASGTAMAASVTYNASTDTATLTPSSALSAGSTYTISVHGGTTGAVIKDVAGNALAANFSSSFTTAAASASQPFPNNQTPPPLPTPTGTVINVSTVSQLQSAVANLKSGQTILIAPGTYKLTGTLYVPQGLTNISIRGATGNAGDVVIEGDAVLDPSPPYTGSAVWGTGSGISGTIPFGIWLGNVQGVTIGDLTIQNFVDDAIILNAGVQSPLIHNVVMKDVGEQFIKSNPNPSGGGVNNGIVEYSTMEYTTGAPNNYTNGIDVHAGQNWIIRDNLFKNITTTNPLTTTNGGALAGPAILFWNGSSNATVENNTFINCQREIAFGLSDPSTITDDNSGGIIENNFIYRSGGQHGDVAIGVWNSPNTEVANNTIILNGDYVNAIEYRYATTTGVKILYNLTDAAIAQRDGASGTVTGNVTNGAQSSWFVNESVGNLHLTSAATGAIGKGKFLPEVSTDYDGQARPSSGPTDVGADEYQAAADIPPTVTSVTPANNATEISTTTAVTVQFSEALDPTTVNSSTIQLLNSSGTAVAATVTYTASTFTATLTPSAALATSSTYTISVHGGTSGAVIKDAADNPLAANFSSSFTTDPPVQSPPPPPASPPPPPPPTTPPMANAGPTESGKEGSAVQFAGTANGGSGSLSYLWNFGDGSTASGTLTPSHTYSTAGTYTVSLTVTDSANESSQSTTTAAVSDVAPTANPGGPYSAAPGTAINFSGSGSVPDPKDTLTYLWNFGDGSTSTSQNPSHAYTSAGNYNVTFTVTASDGAKTTATTTATIAAATTASQDPLLYQANVQYVGAFRVPAVNDPFTPGSNTYDYGGTALAYNPAN
ncbi:MAG TPA: Ig-like domain-containing protein, partial [Gemmataceae bacterium]